MAIAHASTHYQTLGVSPTATLTQVKAAFRRAARQAHPDLPGGSTERMQAVNEAYRVLSDPAMRRTYDIGCMEVARALYRAESLQRTIVQQREAWKEEMVQHFAGKWGRGPGSDWNSSRA